MNDFLTGGFAGIISRTSTAPIERLRILRQNYPLQYQKYSVIDSLKYMYKRGGLYKGNLTNCIRIFPQTAMQYSFFNILKKNSNIQNTLINNFACGGIAGILSYTSIYPLESIRSKLSTQGKGAKYTGILNCFYTSIRTGGLESLYRGSMISAIGMIPFQGLNFSLYYHFQNKYNLEKNKYKGLLSGSVSAMCAVTATYPFDTIKRRLQLSGEMGNPEYRNARHCFNYTISNYGVKGLYRGLLPCYMKMIPTNAIYFFIIDNLQ